MEYIIHDLSNAMVIISGLTDIFELEPEKVTKERIKKLKKAVERAKELLKETKQMVHSNESEKLNETDNIKEICDIKQTLINLEDIYDINIEFKNLGKPNSKKYFVSTFVQNRVIANLIENAKNAGANNIQFTYVSYPNKPYKVLSIRDDGPGMKLENINKLGTGYTTSGGGFGTKFIKNVVSEMGGAVVFRNSKDENCKGLQCTITLPLCFTG
jgi:signal transduction histidine kinase